MVTSENWNTMKVRIFIHSIFKFDVEVLWDTPEEVTYLNEEIFDPLNGPILSQDSSYFILVIQIPKERTIILCILSKRIHTTSNRAIMVKRYGSRR